ncbi:DNA-binding protein Fis [hydrothermal vent metagenome]|uniref:Putative Fis-like DNA-binding protein n=1 Tax=hydrothermal vent metagenome TaxID=652676 RepID=A0A3B0Z8C1_9ZZZZ
MTYTGEPTFVTTETTTPDTAFNRHGVTLSENVKTAMDAYFADLNGETPNDLYRLVINEVEKPLLQTVMNNCNGNQSRAAKILGINRSTLRKKLQLFNIT